MKCSIHFYIVFLLLLLIILGCKNNSQVSNIELPKDTILAIPYERMQNILNTNDEYFFGRKLVFSILNDTLFVFQDSSIRHRKWQYYLDSIKGCEDGMLELYPIRKKHYPYSFVNKKLSWGKWETPISNQEKQKLLSQLMEINLVPMHSAFRRTCLFHPIDFNGDGKLDIIYTGATPTGIEGENFILFENINDSLYPILFNYGRIVGLNKSSTKNGVIDGITVWHYPCCSNPYHGIAVYHLYPLSDSLFHENKKKPDYYGSYSIYNKNYHPNYRLKNVYSYLKTTLLPKKINPSSSHAPLSIIHNNTPLLTNPLLRIGKGIFDEMELLSEESKECFILAKLKKDSEVALIDSARFGHKLYYFIHIKEKLKLWGEHSDRENLVGWILAEDAAFLKK